MCRVKEFRTLMRNSKHELLDEGLLDVLASQFPLPSSGSLSQQVRGSDGDVTFLPSLFSLRLSFFSHTRGWISAAFRSAQLEAVLIVSAPHQTRLAYDLPQLR